MRGHHHRQAAFAVERAQQRGDVELVAEVERRRRLVEQQDVGFLRQRAGDDDALLLAAGQRRERPIGQVRGAGGVERLAGEREVARSFEFERARGGGSVPSARSRARCTRRRGGFPGGRRPDAAPARASGSTVRLRPRQRHRACAGWSRPASRRSSVVLPEPFGPEDADDAAALDGHADVVDARAGSRHPGRPVPARSGAATCAVDVGDVIGLQQVRTPTVNVRRRAG